jgi:DNA-binding beta-propeller fold protein YncE
MNLCRGLRFAHASILVRATQFLAPGESFQVSFRNYGLAQPGSAFSSLHLPLADHVLQFGLRNEEIHMILSRRNVGAHCISYLSAVMLLGICSPAASALGPGEQFITNWSNNTVTVYSRLASGEATPVRTIRTGLNTPFGLFVDQLHNEVFVANKCQNGPCEGVSGQVQVYDLNANYPNDTPKRTIGGSATGLVNPSAITIDLLRNELYVTNDEGSTVVVLSRTASGNATPLRTLSGNNTYLEGPVGLAVDLIHDEMIVVSKASYMGGAGQITVYPRASNGDVSPSRIIIGSQTGFNLPVGIDVDYLRDEIVVANGNANAVLFFARTANGNAAPKRALEGLSTGLCEPLGVLVDLFDNQIVVASSGLTGSACGQSTSVFQSPAGGNETPTRSLILPAGTGPISVAQTLINF